MTNKEQDIVCVNVVYEKKKQRTTSIITTEKKNERKKIQLVEPEQVRKEREREKEILSLYRCKLENQR